MKKAFFIALCLVLLPVFAQADRITLDQEETLSVPTSNRLRWIVDEIDAQRQMMKVKYCWLDSEGQSIVLSDGRTCHSWWCRDIEVPGTNAECVGEGDPYECCTGVGTGTCDDMLDTCFSDVFRFEIRQQDVGTKIGVGLRQLIWNQMKDDILTPGNDGSFEQ